MVPADITTPSPASSLASLFIPVPPSPRLPKATDSFDHILPESPFPSPPASPIPVHQPLNGYDMFGIRDTPRSSRSPSPHPRRARALSRDMRSPRLSRAPSTVSSSSSRSRSRSRSCSPYLRVRRRSRTPTPPSPLCDLNYPPFCGGALPPAQYSSCLPGTIIQPSIPVWPPAPKPVEILTYSFKGKMAYVPAGPTYEDALNHAQEVYPALALVERHRISFHVTGRDQLVRVPKLAWPDLLLDLPKYEVMYIEVDDDAPPKYQGKYQPVIVDEKEIDRPSSSSSKGGIVGWFKALFGRKA